MKKLLLLTLLLVSPLMGQENTAPKPSAIGRHNFVINAGATVPIDLLGGGLGYGVNTEVGYLLHSVRENKTVHSLDIRLGFNALTINYDQENKNRYDYGITQTISGYTTINYSVGRQFNNVRWMFDIIGVGTSFGATKSMEIRGSINQVKYAKATPFTDFVGFRAVLPLGMYLAFNNGLYLGIRQTYDFNFENPKEFYMKDVNISYNIHFNIGYTFGK